MLAVSALGIRLPAGITQRRSFPGYGAAPGARLTARPPSAAGPRPTLPPGGRPLGLRSDRDGVLYIPQGYQPVRPVPLVLALHGATGSSRGPVRNFGPVADKLGLALVVPDSRARTWDAILLGEFGPDRDFIDEVLAAAWSRVRIDPARIGVVGFSDGATYALALARANGDLFSGAAAFSPGFIIPVEELGRPPLFISHGIYDSILPIDACSRRIVPELRRRGYAVTYREFDGDHRVPADVASIGLAAAVTTSHGQGKPERTPEKR